MQKCFKFGAIDSHVYDFKKNTILRKANFVSRNILVYNKSALCRSASPAFSFVLFYTLSHVWLQHLFN